MNIGVPKEIKTNENRVALVPAGAEALAAQGHTRAHRARGGGGERIRGPGLRRRRRATIVRLGRRSVEAGRADHEGEGADRGRSGRACAGAR